MATFEKVGKRWRAVVRKKGFPRISRTFDTKKEANTWAVEYENNLMQDSSKTLPENITFGVLIKRYLAEETPKKKSSRVETLILNRFLLDFKFITNKKADEVSQLDVARWKEIRGKKVKGSTVRREWSSLSAVFSHSIKSWGLPIKENPFLLVRKPQKSKPRDQRINEEDTQTLLDALDYKKENIVESSKHKTAWCLLFAIETAMRAGEILKLKNSDINGKIALLRDTKNGDDRKVPLSTKALDLIKCLPDGFPVGISSGVLDATFRKHRPEELRHITFHDSRHEALSRLAKIIQNPMDLAKISGHRDLKVLLNTYYNPDDKHLVDLLYKSDAASPQAKKESFSTKKDKMQISNNLLENMTKLFILGYREEPLMLAFCIKNKAGVSMPHAFSIDANKLTTDNLKIEIFKNIPDLFQHDSITIYDVNLYIVDTKTNSINKSFEIVNTFN